MNRLRRLGEAINKKAQESQHNTRRIAANFPLIERKVDTISYTRESVIEGGITDTFTRTVASGWGTSDAGIAWTQAGSGSASVSGSVGVLAQAAWSGSPGRFNGITEYLGGSWSSPSSPSGSVRFKLVTPADPVRTQLQFQLEYGVIDIHFQTYIDGTNNGQNQLVLGSRTTNQYAYVDWGTDWWTAKWESSVSLIRVKVWKDGDAEPGSWTLTNSEGFVGHETDFAGRFNIVLGTSFIADDNGPTTVYIDNLDITGVSSPSITIPDNSQSFKMEFPLSNHPHSVSMNLHFMPPETCFECNPSAMFSSSNSSCVADCPQFGPNAGDGNAHPGIYPRFIENPGNFGLNPNGGIIVPVDGVYNVRFLNSTGGVPVTPDAAIIASVRHNGVAVSQQVKRNVGYTDFDLYGICITCKEGDILGGWMTAGGVAFFTPSNFCSTNSWTYINLIGEA